MARMGVGAGVSARELHAVVADRMSEAELVRYFLGGAGGAPLTGARFNSFGGGSSGATANRVTAEDVVAVGLLNVTIPGTAALALVEGSLGRDVAVELAQIPTDVDLGSPAAAELLAAESPASHVWRLLEG